MKKVITVDGNEACAKAAYLFSEVAGIYPITPSSPMAEHIDEWSNKGVLNLFNDRVKVVEMQSEAGAAGFIHGALQQGVLASTFTASQGLLLMIPNMYKMAGEMLPCVMHVAARSLSTHALSIFGDHQDIYATRQTGFCMLASSSVSDAYYLGLISHLSSIDLSLPFLHFFDGFRTSHEINKIEVLDDDTVKSFLNKEALKRFRRRALNTPKVRGTAQNDDIYFQATEARNVFYDRVSDVVNEYMSKINSVSGTDYKPFNYYGSDNATKIIVAMGSVCNTIKEVIDNENTDLGLVEVHLYRPFSVEYLKNVLPRSVKKIAVLDRTKEFGSIGEPLYLDVVCALNGMSVDIVGGRYGLSSKDTTPSQIKAVYDMLDNPINNFTIGIDDDITHLSLKESEYNLKNSKEILIYGLGSDGMVSASKSLIKLVGDNTENYVQGYFEYDSKKSGGVTLSHLRISDKKIRSSYYVKEPDILVISNDTYFSRFKLVENLSNNSIILINTTKTNSELNKIIPTNLKKIIKDKNSKVYKIDANGIASSVGLNGKISTIMQMAIIKVTDLIDFSFAREKIVEYIKDKFNKKGDNIVNANLEAIKKVVTHIEEVNIDDEDVLLQLKEGFIEKILQREGNSIPTSKFLENPDGTFPVSTTSIEKRNIASLVPKYLRDNCSNCGICSMVCPHSVIRSFLLTEEEYNNSPLEVKNVCKKALNMDYYYTVGISVKDCTGCGLCISNCPGFKGNKALTYVTNNEIEQRIFDYLDKNIKDKEVVNKNTVKGLSFVEPNFKYCGACSGCGESTYIKVLTQLFKDSLIIANATGCSSIYGASAPSIPYNLPWASSLFEDNAEYGYGFLMGTNTIKNRIKNIMLDNMNNENSELFKKWIDKADDYSETKYVYDNLTDNIPEELKDLKEYLIHKDFWCIGGDGWAYDIGFGGMDHVLSMNDNINMLILDTEMYSNTGGQASKSSPRGSLASFSTSGKKTAKKDIARMIMSYKNVYVATVSLGANMMQLIRTLNEASAYNGPSLVIAYAPCISHGNKQGMRNSINEEALAVKSGYFPLFRRHPINGFTLDSKNVDFSLYRDFLESQTRYSSLKKINPEEYEKLLEANKKDSMERYEYYKSLSI